MIYGGVKEDCRVATGKVFRSTLSLKTAVQYTIIFFTYSWSKQYTTTTFYAEELSMSAVAIPDWKNVFPKRGLCSTDSI